MASWDAARNRILRQCFSADKFAGLRSLHRSQADQASTLRSNFHRYHSQVVARHGSSVRPQQWQDGFTGHNGRRWITFLPNARFKYRRSNWKPRRYLLALILPFAAVRLDDADYAGQHGDAHAPKGKGKALDVQSAESGRHEEADHPLDDDEDHYGILSRTWRGIERWILEPLGTARRFLFLAILFLPVILTTPILLLELVEIGQRGPPGRRKPRTKERATTKLWYRFLVKQMESAGPTFIKLAQWAGSRRDLFPDILCEMFGRLHSNGKPHSMKYTKRVLEKAFKKPFEEIFDEFDEKPMGIGAVAQAYKGVLKPTVVPEQYLDPKHDTSSTKGLIPRPAAPERSAATVPSTVVAIKVLHPRVEKTINRDLKIMMFLAKIVDMLPGMEWLSFPQEVDVFGTMMRSQLDLTTEARNLQRFEQNFRHRPVVHFPRPLIDVTSRRVLVEEYQDAVPLKAFLREGGGPFDYRIASLGLDAFLNMLLLDNFVHADLHPGNIMVKFYKPSTSTWLTSLYSRIFDKPEEDPAAAQLAQNTEIVHSLRAVSHDYDKWHAKLEQLEEEGYQPEIVFLDTGLVTELHGENRTNFIDLFRAVAEFDGYKAGKLMVERCKSPEFVTDEETFALKMQHLVLSVKSRTFSLAQIRISDILSEVLKSIRNHHVRLEGDFINTVISILLLEGIGRQLDPDMDLFKGALPILRQLGRKMSSTDILKGEMKAGSIAPMLKIYLWMEARELVNVATSEVDDLIRYDALTFGA